MSQIKHQDAISRAMMLIDNGYSASYVYEKLIKEGFSEDEAKSVLENLTHTPFNKPEVLADGSAAPSLETPKAPEESRGIFQSRNIAIFGILLILLGFALYFLLPNLPYLAYAVLIAGPIVILFAAIRTGS